MTQQIAIQGEAGSFSHIATLKIFPNSPKIKFCATFEEAFLLATQKHEINMDCPCENTVAGRVPEFHSLLRRYSLQIYAEHFEKNQSQFTCCQRYDTRFYQKCSFPHTCAGTV